MVHLLRLVLVIIMAVRAAITAEEVVVEDMVIPEVKVITMIVEEVVVLMEEEMVVVIIRVLHLMVVLETITHLPQTLTMQTLVMMLIMQFLLLQAIPVGLLHILHHTALLPVMGVMLFLTRVVVVGVDHLVGNEMLEVHMMLLLLKLKKK